MPDGRERERSERVESCEIERVQGIKRGKIRELRENLREKKGKEKGMRY